jgi:hypothetical protein
MKRPEQRVMMELADDELDGVVGGTNPGGGNGTATISATLGLGPVSIGGSVNLQTGETYFTGGFSPSLSFGGNVALNAVIPFAGHTANDVITGPGYGAEAYFGGGGGVSANSSGIIVSGGFGLSIGGGMTLTAATTPNTTSQTVEVPVYDAMGNATGFTTTVANPMYSPAAEAAQLQSQANQAAANVASIQNLQQIASVPTVDPNAPSPWGQTPTSQPAQPTQPDPGTQGSPQGQQATPVDSTQGSPQGEQATPVDSSQGSPQGQQAATPVDNTYGDFPASQEGGTNSGAGGGGVQNDNTYGDFGSGGGGDGGGDGGG